MRKYIIGAIAGAALMFGIQAGASGVLTGSKVAGEKSVNYNGKSIGQAAIINNYSYLPVRAVSDAMGLKIDLSGGTINLSGETPTTETTPDKVGEESPATPSTDTTLLEGKLHEINDKIDSVNARIAIYQKNFSGLTEGDDIYTSLKNQLDDLHSQLSDLEKQKSDILNELFPVITVTPNG